MTGLCPYVRDNYIQHTKVKVKVEMNEGAMKDKEKETKRNRDQRGLNDKMNVSKPC